MEIYETEFFLLEYVFLEYFFSIFVKYDKKKDRTRIQIGKPK